MPPPAILPEREILPPSPDAQVVAAVRNGDIERFRELVERHQRRVYGLAWSRLGDAALAEEATQEAFIRGYRNLRFLGDGEKFSAWIGAIARNIAVSLGLRHRRELNRRERWALEQPAVEAPAEIEDEASITEVLRQTLAELPDAHRECLVLFYLEGKSGAEAAAMLGISEEALRARLLRARGALRERLEKRLDESLEQLRPPQTLVPAVMAAVATTQMKAGGGLSATVVALLAKILPAKFLPFLAPIAAFVPGLGAAWYGYRLDLRNFKDQTGFRARLFRQTSADLLWFTAALIAFNLALVYGSIWAFGVHGLHVVMGFYALFFAWLTFRQAVICRHRAQIFMLAYYICLAVIMLGAGVGWISLVLAAMLNAAGCLFLLPVMRDRPTRMDYSLFLRAAQKLLPDADATIIAGKFARGELLAFARQLGSRWLVCNYRWDGDVLTLRLAAAKFTGASRCADLFPFGWETRSRVVLGEDGSVTAFCGLSDAGFLQKMSGDDVVDMEDLEKNVAAAVAAAWQAHRRGDTTAMERALGQASEAEVFVKPPAKSPAWRFTAVVMAIAVMLGFIGTILVTLVRPHHPARLQFVQEQQVRVQEQANAVTEKINAINDVSRQWLAQARQLEQHAAASAPADAEKLRQQAEDLRQKAMEADIQVAQRKQQLELITAEMRRLQVEYTQIQNPAWNGTIDNPQNPPGQ